MRSHKNNLNPTLLTLIKLPVDFYATRNISAIFLSKFVFMRTKNNIERNNKNAFKSLASYFSSKSIILVKKS